MLNRRHFNIGFASLAFSGLANCTRTPRGSPAARARGYGPLLPDRAGLFDLPAGFTYRIISAHGATMDDGFPVPSNADGMGAFALDRDRTILVRNHELRPSRAGRGPFAGLAEVSVPVFDRGADGLPSPGGTTTLIYNQRTGRVETQYLSLAGTLINCAGGVTPWGSWLSCEEEAARAGTYGLGQDHGWVFEVPARQRGLVQPVPLRAMGRFEHEAAAVDPRTGIIYLTEDQDDSLLYRFLPDAVGRPVGGGRLQALGFAGSSDGADTRNWAAADFPAGAERPVRWIDLDNVESPDDDLRMRGHAKGAALFARGEGICLGGGDFYFTCTSGGAAKLGQIMRYRPSRFEGRIGEAAAPGRLTNFVESTDPDMLNYGDNLVLAPTGDLIVCEDQYSAPVSNHLRGITPDGRVYPFALLRAQTELAGACFSADGKVMFVNIYHPGKTLAITGPWSAARA
jgi:secreted PhoX family phosphatase